MSALKYGWWDRLASLGAERAPSSFNAISDVIAFGGWFVLKYGDWAEAVGMQPVHLLRFPKGLAWRVASVWKAGHWSVLCFPRKAHMVAEVNDWMMVYRFEPDGSISPVFGTARKEILGAAIALQASPPAHIQRAQAFLQGEQ